MKIISHSECFTYSAARFEKCNKYYGLISVAILGIASNRSQLCAVYSFPLEGKEEKFILDPKLSIVLPTGFPQGLRKAAALSL